MIHTQLIGRYIALILASSLAGAINVVAHPILIGRGASLGFSLAIGIIIINTMSEKNLSLHKQPAWKIILFAAIISGCLGGIMIDIFSRMTETGDDLGALITRGIATPALVVCYNLVLHIAYAFRWNTSKLFTMFFIALAGLFCGIIRMVILLAEYSHHVDASMLAIGAPISGGFFALFWGIAVILCDPAWSFERWNYCAGNRDNKGNATCSTHD